MARLCLIYKIINSLVAVPLPDYLQSTHRISRYCHSMTFRQIHTDKDYYKYSLFKQICNHMVGLVRNYTFATNPLVADLFLFRYERDFMKDLSNDNQADIIKAFNSMSLYLDVLLNIDNPYFEGLVNQIYPLELQLNKANTSDAEAPFLDLHLSISNGFVSSKIYDKRDAFDFDIVYFPFLDGDVPRRPSYGVDIFQLIRFVRICSHVDDFNTRKKCFTAKLLKQGHQGISEPEFYGDLVYKYKKIRGMTDFSDQFRKIIMRYKRIGYNLNVMRQSACLVINPITVGGFAALFNCTPVDWA